MNGVLKALAYVAPKAALRRAHAVASLETQKRYAGATAGRRAAGWGNANKSANTAVGDAISRLRARSHQMVRDHWAGQRILDVTVAHAIGFGIEVLPDNGSDLIDRQVKEEFEEWAETADITGEGGLSYVSEMAVRAMLEGGSSFCRMINRRSSSNPRRVPLALSLLEAEHLDHLRDGKVDGRSVRLGTAVDEFGERLGYYLHAEHPGETGVSMTGSGGAATLGTSEFHHRRDVIHLYRALRPTQLLGVPVFAPIFMTARDLSDLLDAAIVKARTEACFGGFITSPAGDMGIGGNDDALSEVTSNGINKFEPGMLVRLQHGEGIEFAEPKSSGSFVDVYDAGVYAMAAGAGITHDQLTGDLRKANYSSLRAGKIEFRRLIEQMQWLTIIPKFHARIAARWAEEAIVAGVIPPSEKPYRWKYVTPANEPIDPRKDIEADIMAVRAGRMSPQEFIAGWGRDWREVVQDFRAFFEEVDKGDGLSLDIDPRSERFKHNSFAEAGDLDAS